MIASGQVYSDVPWLTLSDIRVFGVPSWEVLDELASTWLGQPCLALPSVRVGLCWALEAQEYARYRDHILVPRFVGRCILNSVGRFALPVESPTAQTRIALVVDQFGRRQDISALTPRFAREHWSYIEDSPYGIGVDEWPGAGSLGRFIGLGKVLPVVQGALFVAGDDAISRSIKTNRQKSSPWALPVWLTMLFLRKRFASGYSDAADAAYEMYPASRGGCTALRGNLVAIFDRIKEFEYDSQSRLTAVVESLGEYVLIPDHRRLSYVVPLLPGVAMKSAQEIFRQFGFNDAALHVDINQNMLTPTFAKTLVIPINSRIPRERFDLFLLRLRALLKRYESVIRSMNELKS